MIEIKKLNKSFEDHNVINNFSYKVEDGKMIAITGKSGCGKTTLLNILGLLDDDYSGEILYDNKKITKKEKNEFIRYNINYLFQNYALIDTQTVEENLLLALEYVKMNKKEKIEHINKALNLVELENFNNKKIFTLSGGEQQRVALARITLKPGNIILADEPTGNLDNENSQKVINILKEIKQQGKTIIIVTHNEEIAKQCDEIIKL